MVSGARIPVGTGGNTAVGVDGVPVGRTMERPHYAAEPGAGRLLHVPTGQGLINSEPQVGQNRAVNPVGGSGWP